MMDGKDYALDAAPPVPTK